MDNKKKLTVRVSETRNCSFKYREDGSAYNRESWTKYDARGCICERGYREVEVPWMNRSIAVEPGTVAELNRILKGAK